MDKTLIDLTFTNTIDCLNYRTNWFRFYFKSVFY